MRFFGGGPGSVGTEDSVVRQAAQDAARERLAAQDRWQRLAKEFDGMGRRFSRTDEPPSTWRVEGRWWRRPVTGWPLRHVDSTDILVARRSGGFAVVRHAHWHEQPLPRVVSVRRVSADEAALLQFETVCEREGVLLASVRCGGQTWGYPDRAGVLHPVSRLMAMLAVRQDPNRPVPHRLVGAEALGPRRPPAGRPRGLAHGSRTASRRRATPVTAIGTPGETRHLRAFSASGRAVADREFVV